MENCIYLVPEAWHPRDYNHGVTSEVHSKANNTWDYHWNHDRVTSCIAAVLLSNLQTHKHRWQVSTAPLHTRDACRRNWKHENNEKAKVKVPCRLKLLSKDSVWCRWLEFWCMFSAFSNYGKKALRTHFQFCTTNGNQSSRGKLQLRGKNSACIQPKNSPLFHQSLKVTHHSILRQLLCFVCKQLGIKTIPNSTTSF